ncbi:hypothetical protein Glove_181g9 [Diversispora epigaea]|uniref:Uncharacterized protein n=1 Tax=Diversispora epigaea TaxID=1348612 RepID=A0A397IU63_9GLOM|nr:hypothetical protein Glove_181g9 [Diversispora epigaea]
MDCTSEKQSVASINRKEDGFMRRHPLICTTQKKIDDDTLKLDKDQFDIIGVQIAGNELHLNLLVQDMVNVHRYYYFQSAKISVQFLDEKVVYKFIETLLLLRNLIITNLSLLYHASVIISERQKEDSTTVSTPLHDNN